MGEEAFIRRTRHWRAGCTQTCPSGSGGGGWIPLATRGWPPTSSLVTWACARRSITPTHATLSATGYILLQPEPAKATAWSLPEHLHGHPGQGLATGRVDLAGHDQGARLVLRDFQFCEACAQV